MFDIIYLKKFVLSLLWLAFDILVLKLLYESRKFDRVDSQFQEHFFAYVHYISVHVCFESRDVEKLEGMHLVMEN